MAAPLKIRYMEIDDIEPVIAIDREIFPDPWSEDSLRRQMESSHALYLAAESGGRILGYLGTQLVLDEGEILRIGVGRAWREKHIGTLLLRELSELTPGTVIWNLEVRESNAPAIALYRKFGFAVIGRRRRYYRDPEEDAVLMQMRRGES